MQSINRHTREEMQYSGVLDAIRRMLADEGVGSFYRVRWEYSTMLLW
jgi:hypothetical protein